MRTYCLISQRGSQCCGRNQAEQGRGVRVGRYHGHLGSQLRSLRQGDLGAESWLGSQSKPIGVYRKAVLGRGHSECKGPVRTKVSACVPPGHLMALGPGSGPLCFVGPEACVLLLSFSPHRGLAQLRGCSLVLQDSLIWSQASDWELTDPFVTLRRSLSSLNSI